MAKTLTAGEWLSIFTLPDDARPYNVPGIAFRAVHYPASKMKVESVSCETQYGTLRRRCINGRWLATEYVSSL